MSNFRMKMGAKQRDTEGNISEKDSNLIKSSHLYKMAGAPLTAPGAMYETESAKAELAKNAPSDYEQMGAAFEKGQKDGDALASAMSGDQAPPSAGGGGGDTEEMVEEQPSDYEKMGDAFEKGQADGQKVVDELSNNKEKKELLDEL